MSYPVDTNPDYQKWECNQCTYINKRFLCCGQYVYGGYKAECCAFCDTDKKDAKHDDTTEFNASKRQDWQAMIVPNIQQFIDSEFLDTKSYRYDDVPFSDPSYDLNPQFKNFKAECVESKRLTEVLFDLILSKAKSILKNKALMSKFTANYGAGINVDIQAGDSMGIEHIFVILLYIHFPKYVQSYRHSLPSKSYFFGKFFYEVVTYFGRPMPADMVVYVGLTITEEATTSAAVIEQEFLNTAFLMAPFSACKDADIFGKDVVVLSLQTQFLDHFNDTKYFDLSSFSSFGRKQGKNEVVFFGEFAELSVMNIAVSGDGTSAVQDFKPFMDALNIWQKMSSGFADYDSAVYNAPALTEQRQQILADLLNLKEEKIPKYIFHLFKYYNESKTGASFHSMYDDVLDVDFSLICNNLAQELNKEIQGLLFNEDVTDIDPKKIKRIFPKAKQCNNTNGEQTKL
mmetsp:Transcript_26905/g.44103  ORF Transcript_26905/g.44103 Transcript_26905/m.44103 type:complete len:458 (+) Transcript_26905:35-1408(+)